MKASNFQPFDTYKYLYDLLLQYMILGFLQNINLSIAKNISMQVAKNDIFP